jgi:hypothetical protein
MKNPYEILNISQDATKQEIIAAQKQAMLQRKFPMNEIALATKQLLDAEKRLAADFMYPSKLSAKRPKKIETEINVIHVDLNTVNPDAFCSLKLA